MHNAESKSPNGLALAAAGNPSMKIKPRSFHRLLKQVHGDQRGAVSIETVLIIAAVALPILIFMIKIGWPMIKSYFSGRMTELTTEGDKAKSGN